MDPPREPPFRLTLLGPWDLRGPNDVAIRSVLSQPKRLCLLAYLALRAEPVSRSTLVSLFWPESDEDRARNALSQSVHYLRRSLSKDAVRSVEGDRLEVPEELVWFDAREVLGRATRTSSNGIGGAESSADGPAAGNGAGLSAEVQERLPQGAEFFEGWNAEDSQPLQEWLDGVRRRVGVEGGQVERPTAPAKDLPASIERPSGRSELVFEPDVVDDRVPTLISKLKYFGVAVAWLVIGYAALSVVAETGGRAAGDAASTVSVQRVVAVLQPLVVLGDDAPPFLPEVLHAEIVAQLSASIERSVVSLPFGIAEFNRFLATQGLPGDAEEVLSVTVRATADRARITITLHGGPSFTETLASTTKNYVTDSLSEALIDLPVGMAGDVVAAIDSANPPTR